MRYTHLNVKGKEYKLRYTFNSLADIEQQAGKSITRLFEAEDLGMNTIRLLLWGGLRHNDKGVTLDRVGMIIDSFLDEKRDLEELMDVINDAISKSKLFENTQGESDEGNE